MRAILHKTIVFSPQSLLNLQPGNHTGGGAGYFLQTYGISVITVMDEPHGASYLHTLGTSCIWEGKVRTATYASNTRTQQKQAFLPINAQQHLVAGVA